MKSHALSGLLLVVSGLSAAGCVVGVDSQALVVRDEKRFSVKGTPEVHLTTFDGAIEVRSWDKSDVLVEIEKRGATRDVVDALQVRASQNGNRIELEVKQPRTEGFSGIGFHRSTSAKLIVSVPRNTNLIATSGDGSIRIDGVAGKLALHTGDGSIRANDVAGELTLKTGDGSITVDGAEGRLELETGDGGVNVAGKLASVKLRTHDGSIVYRAESGSEMRDDWDISTGDGGVTLYLPRDFSADVDAETGDGSIHDELNVPSSARREDERRTLRGRLGDGGKVLRIRTGDGSIRLRES
jgi:DUF4097 and DUF4098 domain-containing protein YvlB